MVNIDRLGERLGKHLEVATEGIRAELGKLEVSGSYTILTGQDNEVYCRIEGDPKRTVTAINTATAYIPRLPVRIRRNTSGRYVVIGIDHTEALLFMGQAAGAATMPPLIAEAVRVSWLSEQFRPGSIRPLNGADLQVYMESMPYGDVLLGGVSLNLATVAGTITSGKKAPVVISVNPSDNTLTATKGAEVGLPIPLSRQTCAAVSVPAGEIKLWVYIIQNGVSALPTSPAPGDTAFQYDLRQWLTPTYTLTIEESDGTPSVTGVTKVIVSNGTLTDNGGGEVELTTGGGASINSDELNEQIWIGVV